MKKPKKIPMPSNGDPYGYDGGITIPGIFAIVLIIVIEFMWAIIK